MQLVAGVVMMGLMAWGLVSCLAIDPPKAPPAAPVAQASAPVAQLAPAPESPPDAAQLQAALEKCGTVLSSALSAFERGVCQEKNDREQAECSDATFKRDQKVFRTLVGARLDKMQDEIILMTGGNALANLHAKQEFMETRFRGLLLGSRTEPSACLLKRTPVVAHASDLEPVVRDMVRWAAVSAKLELTDNRAAYKRGGGRGFCPREVPLPDG